MRIYELYYKYVGIQNLNNFKLLVLMGVSWAAPSRPVPNGGHLGAWVGGPQSGMPGSNLGFLEVGLGILHFRRIFEL